jgi:pimeloyl-ACP methyl ester carboxylesterase
MKVTTRHHDFGHSRLEWKETGPADGDLLFFLHGYPESPSTWDQQLKYFSGQYLCVAPFNRGVGHHSLKEKTSAHGRDSLVLDLLGLVKIIDPDGRRKVACVGHDLGAPLAARFARLLGDRLSVLVMTGGISLSQMKRRLHQPKQWLKSWYIFPILIPGVMETVLKHTPKFLLDLSQRKSGMPDRLAEEWHKDPQQLLEPLQQYREYFWEMLVKSDPVSERIEQPLLMLFGNRDPYLIAPTMDEARLLSHHSQVRILEGGHWLHEEKAAQVNAYIDQFIKEATHERRAVG